MVKRLTGPNGSKYVISVAKNGAGVIELVVARDRLLLTNFSRPLLVENYATEKEALKNVHSLEEIISLEPEKNWSKSYLKSSKGYVEEIKVNTHNSDFGCNCNNPECVECLTSACDLHDCSVHSKANKIAAKELKIAELKKELSKTDGKDMGRVNFLKGTISDYESRVDVLKNGPRLTIDYKRGYPK